MIMVYSWRSDRNQRLIEASHGCGVDHKHYFEARVYEVDPQHPGP